MTSETLSQDMPQGLRQEAAQSTFTGPGSRLRSARVAAGFSVDDVAKQLHLSTWVIESLERDDYGGASTFTFIRGYLRNYARAVGESPDDIIKSFDAMGLEETAANGISRIPLFRKRATFNEQFIKWGAVAIGVIIITLVTVWWRDGHTTMPTMTGVSNNDTTIQIEPHTAQSAVDSLIEGMKLQDDSKSRSNRG